MSKNNINDNTNKLFLTTKIISTSALFMLIITLMRSIELLMVNNLITKNYSISNYFNHIYIAIIAIYFLYIMFQVIHYLLSIKQNYKLHSLLKVELILSIVFIAVLFFLILKG